MSFAEDLHAFLTAIHGPDATGVIEVRLIEERKGGELVDRRWFESAQALVDALPDLLQRAEDSGAAIFFGVLRRRATGCGKAADCLDGNVVWADVDYRDFDGGATEARELIRDLPIDPTFLVRSGHGLHVYFVLREAASPARLSELSKELASAIGGDHAFDAARLLRLPGTYNIKVPDQPELVEFVSFFPEDVYNESDIVEALEFSEPSTDDRPGTCAPLDGAVYFNDQLHPPVAALIHQRKRISNCFNGKGKRAHGRDGRELDHSSSGYDFSLIVELAKAGVQDVSMLATALWNRPDRQAREKGHEYILRTVQSALELVSELEAEAANFAVDFNVDRLRIFNSNPARYEFTVGSVCFTITSQQLRSPKGFAVAFMDAAHRIPLVPSKADVWAQLVNDWLAKAETVELPPDASFEPGMIEAIERIIAELVVGDCAEDLDHGKALRLADGQLGLKASAVIRRLRDDYPSVDASDVARLLKKLGYGSHTTTVGGKPVRLWRYDAPTP
ncbi:MAG: hypothetical protein IPK60_20755 [Sandaracinaceae bacterium]|nr:hypothetical protein [Sandaracinaceae bacterium]